MNERVGQIATSSIRPRALGTRQYSTCTDSAADKNVLVPTHSEQSATKTDAPISDQSLNICRMSGSDQRLFITSLSQHRQAKRIDSISSNLNDSNVALSMGNNMMSPVSSKTQVFYAGVFKSEQAKTPLGFRSQANSRIDENLETEMSHCESDRHFAFNSMRLRPAGMGQNRTKSFSIVGLKAGPTRFG